MKQPASKKSVRTGIICGITATAFVITGLTMFANRTPTRLSGATAIAAQQEFQSKLQAALDECQQKVDAERRRAEQK
jgi:hypothetical protein